MEKSLNWILEIFSDKSEQAKLIAILISSLVAISVVLLNQWFTSRRTKKDLLVEKIEELFSTSHDYIKACKELLEALSNPEYNTPYYSYPKDSKIKFEDSLRKLEMICGLYFPKEGFSIEEFYMWRMPILEIAHKGKFLEEGEGTLILHDSWEHVRKSESYFGELCKKLMKKHGH
jgi:hypothetical protein